MSANLSAATTLGSSPCSCQKSESAKPRVGLPDTIVIRSHRCQPPLDYEGVLGLYVAATGKVCSSLRFHTYMLAYLKVAPILEVGQAIAFSLGASFNEVSVS
eukprot:TRINITY_DN32529_c0_g1_i1.p1 TRINITY_DN32529_c0_g1~~TRINITY_DN32529_c0_g1_i1.p1  ORF type:complete len:102 (-),score=9.34 TRINITY_DN32529_c0_g1_i1:182-487(-)